PEGFVGWNKETFFRLVNSTPEPLISRFQVTHGMLLNVLSREDEDGCRAMQKIIRDSHEPQHVKPALRRRAWDLFRALLDRKIVEITPERIRVNVELQEDFSLDQTLSLYLVDTIKLLDNISIGSPSTPHPDPLPSEGRGEVGSHEAIGTPEADPLS